MTTQEIITKFELYVDDATELSTVEELALANEKYREICAERPWEFLKTAATGTLSTSVPYVSLPEDFSYISANHDYTEFTSASEDTQSPTVVFVGSNYRPIRIVNWSTRRQYRDQDGYAYVDHPNSRLYFTKQPTTADSYEFDYIKDPATLALGTEPLFPEKFHPLLYLAMAADDDIIQRFEKARSYLPENRAKYQALLRSMALWNAQFMMN